MQEAVMQAVRRVRPIEFYGLIGMLLFMSVGALYGGYSFIGDPSGEQVDIPAE
jgi:hypothetical protein